VQPTGASRLAQRRIGRQRRLAPVADLTLGGALRHKQPAMKTLIPLLLAGLVLTSGCITQHVVVNHAKPHEKSTLVKGEHAEDSPFLAKWETESVPGQPAYYALVPLTVSADVATAPVQIPVMIYVLLFERHP
jgi:hypothetical protein